MPRGNYRQTIGCADPACPETVTHRHETRADEAASAQFQRERPWKCERHSKPEQVLSPGREALATVLTVAARPGARSWETPRVWQGPGFPFCSDLAHGYGFMAFANDWPEGARLEITARILPPEGNWLDDLAEAGRQIAEGSGSDG